MKNPNFNRLFFTTIFVMLLSIFTLPSCIVDISKENCVAVVGEVENIEEGSSYDVFVTLKGDNRRFYINRGLERGLTMSGLQEELIGAEIELWHAKHWATHGGHVTQMKLGKKMIYSEWEN